MPEICNDNEDFHKTLQQQIATLRVTSSMQDAMMTKTAVSETSRSNIKFVAVMITAFVFQVAPKLV